MISAPSLLDLGSKYFTWREVTASQTAERLGLDNTPDDETQATILRTAARLDQLREFLNAPVVVSSWYRAPKVNAAVKSRSTSQHIKGEAVDFVSPRFGSADEVFSSLRPNLALLGIDQLIREFPQSTSGGWIHVSFSDAPRHAALIIDNNGTRSA